MAAPIVTFSKTSDYVSTNLSSTVTFSCDINFQAFKAMATIQGSAYGLDVGVQVMSMQVTPPSYYPANTDYVFVIDYTKLTLGENQYRISLYAQGMDGTWSDKIQFGWDTNSSNVQGWDTGYWPNS